MYLLSVIHVLAQLMLVLIKCLTSVYFSTCIKWPGLLFSYRGIAGWGLGASGYRYVFPIDLNKGNSVVVYGGLVDATCVSDSSI